MMERALKSAADEDLSFPDFILNISRDWKGYRRHIGEEENTSISNDYKPKKFQLNKKYALEYQKTYKMENDPKYLTDSEWEKMNEDNYQSELKFFEEEGEEVDLNIKKIRIFERLLKKTLSWNPPTEDHIEFRETIVNSLESQIKYTNTKMPYRPEKWETKTHKRITMENYQYNKDKKKEECIEEAKDIIRKNKWFDDIYQSVK